MTYGGSIGTSSGSWDDYHNSSSIDPTGSYLTTYISTIGIYDKDGDMVVVLLNYHNQLRIYQIMI